MKGIENNAVMVKPFLHQKLLQKVATENECNSPEVARESDKKLMPSLPFFLMVFWINLVNFSFTFSV